MNRHSRPWTSPIFACLILACSSGVFAGEKRAIDLLPPSTLVYAELPDPRALIGLVLDHPLVRKLTATPQYQQAIQTPQYQQLQQLRVHLEQQLGTDWRKALETLTAGGIYLGVDAATQGVVGLVKSEDPAMLTKLRDTLLNLARQDAAGKGLPDPVQSADYRGVTTYRTDQAAMAVIGPWLVVSNKPDLGRWVLDSYLENGRSSLGADAVFQAAKAKATPEIAGWGYFRVGTLRAFGIGTNALNKKSDNVGTELIIGGILAALQQAEVATAELKTQPEGFRLTLAATPCDTAKVSPARTFHFAPVGEGSAAAPLRPEGAMLNVTLYRDLGAMWLAAPDLFDDNVATGLAQSDSQLSNFFGGRSFSGDVLRNIGPRFHVVVARQVFKPADGPVPAIKLPAAALVFQVKDRQAMGPLMQLAFQTITAFGNVAATQAGGPAMMITNEKRGDITLAYASYLVMPDDKAMSEAPINYNATPSLALIGDYVILSTTKALAEELADLATKQEQGGATISENALIDFNGPAALAALSDNRSHLVAQNMISQGNTQSQAEQAVDLYIEALSYIEGADLRLTPGADGMRMELGLKLRTVK